MLFLIFWPPAPPPALFLYQNLSALFNSNQDFFSASFRGKIQLLLFAVEDLSKSPLKVLIRYLLVLIIFLLELIMSTYPQKLAYSLLGEAFWAF